MCSREWGKNLDVFSNEKSVLMLMRLMTLCIFEKKTDVSISFSMKKELRISLIMQLQ